MIAGILTLGVDPFLKTRLMREAERGVFKHLIGFDHEPELKAALQKIAFETKLYARDYLLEVKIEDSSVEGSVKVSIAKTFQIINQGLEEQPFKPGWEFATYDRARDCKIFTYVDGEQAAIGTPAFAETDKGYCAAFGKTRMIQPRHKQKRYRFKVECAFESRRNWYHPIYFAYPTIGLTVNMTAPPGWQTWIGRKTDASNETVSSEAKLYMMGDFIELQWSSPN